MGEQLKVYRCRVLGQPLSEEAKEINVVQKTDDLMFLIVLGGVNGLLKMRHREVVLFTSAAQLLKGRTGGNPDVLRRQ